jgi:hypothetical protein
VRLTHVRQCFDAALDVVLLGRADPGAVINPEGGLEQLDEDGLVGLTQKRGRINIH